MKYINPISTEGYEELIEKCTKGLAKARWVNNTNRKKQLIEGGREGARKLRAESCPAVVRWDYLYKNRYVLPLFDKLNPELIKDLELLVNKYYPSVQYNSFTINRNAEMLPHKDKGNRDSSFIIGLGDYTGGRLAVDTLGKENTEDSTADYKYFDIKQRGFLFDGCNNLHKVEPFTGTRYTLVAYYI